MRDLVRLTCMAALSLLAGTPAASAQGYDLEIITPHNEHIQREFELGFSRHMGREVRIRWLKQGTGQLIKVLEAKDRATPGGTFDLDVFFGGGVPDHDLAASRGYLEKPNLPKQILDGIPPEIAGVANYDPKGLWYGSALSSFGVLLNRRGLAAQGLSEMRTWEDLGNPKMYSWIILADPRKSSSVRVSYELILQQYGWDAGWGLLMRIAGNARQFADASSAIPNEIATGNVLAGPCIDFYAQARVAQAGDDVLGYIHPQGGSAITPDPISMLRQPPHRELAEKFIAFVLSPEGQRLWILPPGAPGGPVQHPLYRLPVRPDVFSESSGKLKIKNPYEEAGSGVFRTMDGDLQNRRTTLVAELIGAAQVDLHEDVRRTWKAVIDGGMKPAALEEWNRPPFSMEEGLALAEKLDAGGRDARRITRDWIRLFQRKYERVRELAR